MAHFVSTSPQQFAVHFATKSWLLLAAKTNTPFIIGDNPVVMQNLPDADGLRGTLGLAVQGIEIYLPLSPRRALAFWCPSHLDRFRAWAATTTNPTEEAFALEVISSLEHGGPLQYREPEVLNFNSLQIVFAERFLFSALNDFSVAEEMIAKHPGLRGGPRPIVVS